MSHSILDEEMPQIGETLRYQPKQNPVIEVGELYEVEEVKLAEVPPYHPNGVWLVRVSHGGLPVRFLPSPESPFWLQLDAFKRPGG